MNRPIFHYIFLLRLWREQDSSAKDPDPLRIILEDPRNGTRHSFASLSSLVTFLETKTMIDENHL